MVDKQEALLEAAGMLGSGHLDLHANLPPGYVGGEAVAPSPRGVAPVAFLA